MMQFVIFGAAALVFVLLVGLTVTFKRLAKSDKDGWKLGESGFTLEGISYGLIIITVIYVLALAYYFARGTSYEGHMMEWMNIVVRLMHITFGIAWIGASFYFVFLENALNRTHNVREELAGNLW